MVRIQLNGAALRIDLNKVHWFLKSLNALAYRPNSSTIIQRNVL
jgi:hypothetical protein